MTKRWPALLAAASLCVAPACADLADAPPPATPSLPAGTTIPDFQKPDLTGRVVDTKALRGKVVALKFFARYCEPCLKTLPEFATLARERKDVVFLGVSEDESEDAAKELVREFDLAFPVVFDPEQALADRFRVGLMPTVVVVDVEGKIRWVGGPTQTEADLVRALAEVTKPAPAPSR
jgi:cytochrome c biogenesis protein CcmG/thiol:disulfide interchange protein DsbE